MTCAQLESILIKNNVPMKYYSFDGAGGGDLWALENLDGAWTISYFSERGGRDWVTTYRSENDACLAFLDRMSKVLMDEQKRPLIRS